MSSYTVQPAAEPLVGRVSVPGDKSIGHRSLLFGALADGVVHVTGVSDGADNRATLGAIRALGVRVDEAGGELVIHGVGLDGLRAADGAIDCGNSGTSMRLLAGLLAGQEFVTTLTGDDSLTRRPMRRVADPLGQMGASITGADGANPSEIYPPLRITGGALHGIEYRLPMASAQVKSAVLLAGLFADGPTRVIEPGRARDHTERMLAHMGAPIAVRAGGVIELDPTGWDRRLAPGPVAVPGDPSSAAFIVAAALIAGAERVCVAGVCVNETRTGFLDALAAMGARVKQQARTAGAGEATADLVIARGSADAMAATIVEGDVTVRAIDELPVLAVVASRVAGATEFRDAGELRVKESDRIATTVAMLRGFGVEVDEREDGFTVHGNPAAPLRPARVDAAGDHRIAMSAAVAALAASGPVIIDDVDNVATSFPTFPEILSRLGVSVDVS